MKKFALALALVMALSTSAFAATTVTGWVQYGFVSQGSTINWDGLDAVNTYRPQVAVVVGGDNFQIRLDNITSSGVNFPNALSIGRAFVKLPVEGVGTFTIGRAKLATSSNGALDTTYTGFGYAGSFDKLSLSGVVAPDLDKDNKEQGYTLVGRGAYGLDLGGFATTVGATFKKYATKDDPAYAVDATVALSETASVYVEYGQDKAGFDPTSDTTDKFTAIGGSVSAGGFDFSGSYDIDNKAASLSAEKTINGVLFHLGYDFDSRAKTDAYAHEDAKITGYAKVSF